MKTITKKVAEGTEKLLKSFLKLDANSTSCFVVYQPKAPKELSEYRRKK